MVYEPDAHADLIDTLWRDPDSLIDVGDKLIQKKCVRTTVKLAADEEFYVIKRHLERSWRHQFKQCFSTSRAAKCWNDTWRLVERGYPTPRPIAYRENRFGPLRGSSFLVYQYVEGKTLKDLAAGLKNQRLLRHYVSQLAGIWRMHKTLGINLNDSHPGNFVIDSTGKMWVIDLDKLQYIKRPQRQSQWLTDSFMKTLKGVFGDQSVIRYGTQKIDEILNEQDATDTWGSQDSPDDADTKFRNPHSTIRI